MKKVRGRHCENDRLIINSIFMLNKGLTASHSLEIRDGSRFSNIRIVNLIIEYRLGYAIIF